jgi:hypothetical protein
MADNEQMAAAKKRLADEKQAREKVHAEHREAMSGVKPTPTQEENDLAAMGVHVLEHEPDGSTDPNEAQTKQAEADKRTSSYKTRQATPAT